MAATRAAMAASLPVSSALRMKIRSISTAAFNPGTHAHTLTDTAATVGRSQTISRCFSTDYCCTSFPQLDSAVSKAEARTVQTNLAGR
jgi:hypothetical protein